jgi:hypothetical protein
VRRGLVAAAISAAVFPALFSAPAEAAPISTGPPTIARAGRVLTVTPGSYIVIGTLQLSHQWRRCDAAGANCSDILGATATTYTLVTADIGRTIVVREMATDDGIPGTTTTDSTATPVIAADPPQNTSLPTVSGTARDGQTLTSTDGSWTGDPPTTFTRQWRRCDGSGAACTNIAGATGTSYVLKPADVGHTIRLRVVAEGLGTASADSAATGVVLAISPTNSVPPAVAGTFSQGGLVSASRGIWSGTPTISFAYQWQRCGPGCADIPGQTATSYRLTAADVGKRVRVAVTATNLGGSQTAFSSQSSVVLGPATPPPRSIPPPTPTPTPTPKPKPTKLKPFPVVVIAGRFTQSGVILTKLTVRAPKNSKVTVLCRGKDCPKKSASRRVGASRKIRLRSYQRRLRAGTVLKIFIRKAGKIGKYTRFLIRRGKPPARRDRCLVPGKTQPVRCSTL